MPLAWLVTLLAICGAAAGAFIGVAGRLSDHLAAAGGGLLFGISLFWLIPEAAESTGRTRAFLLATGIGLALVLIDRLLARHGHSARHGVIWPLLLATAIHSLLDGWSVRVVGMKPLTNVAATAGLALHKIPEGAALGWVARRALKSSRQAFLYSTAAELFTIVGAFAEPGLDASGISKFGAWWTPAVLSVVAGGFLFLGLHALEPAKRRGRVYITFLGMLLLVGALTYVRPAI